MREEVRVVMKQHKRRGRKDVKKGKGTASISSPDMNADRGKEMKSS
jgi:hypothetical protein